MDTTPKSKSGGRNSSSMGKVISLGGRVPEYKFDTSTLHNQVRSLEVTSAVQGALRWMTGIDTYKIPPLRSHLFAPQESAPEGICTLQVIDMKRNGKMQILVVDAAFPEYLVKNGVVPRTAVLGAAVMARSLDALNNIVMSTPLGIRFVETVSDSDSLRIGYWDQDNLNLARIGLYRASAALAVHVTGIDFDTIDQPPYPEHIAGLMNPLNMTAG